MSYGRPTAEIEVMEYEATRIVPGYQIVWAGRVVHVRRVTPLRRGRYFDVGPIDGDRRGRRLHYSDDELVKVAAPLSPGSQP